MKISVSYFKKILFEHKVILVNFSFLSITQFFTLLLPLITYPYLIRTLGKDTYGLYAFANSSVTYFTIIINFGFNLSASKDIAQNIKNKEKLSEIVSSVYIIKIILLILSFSIYLILLLTVSKLNSHFLFHLLTFSFCIGDLLIPTWFFQGIEKMKYTTYVHIISRLFFTLMIFFVVHSYADVLWLPILNFLGILFSGIYCSYLVFYKYNISFKIERFNIVFSYFKASFPFFLSRVSSIFNTESNTVLIGFFLTMKDVANYDLAKRIIDMALIPFGMLNNAIYPKMAREKNISFIKKILKIVVFSSIIFALLISLFSKYIILILGGAAMLDSQILLYLLSFSLPMYAISYFLGNTVLVVLGKSVEFNKSVIYQTIIFTTITIFAILLNIWGVYQASLIISISSIFMVIYRYFYIKKYKLL